MKVCLHLLLTTLLIMHATPLLKTGQIKSYDEYGNEVTDGSVKDDGYYQAGTARSYSRISNIVIDDITGLQWQDNENILKPFVTRENYLNGDYTVLGDTAAAYCYDLVLDGYRDWRLPSINELNTLTDYKNSNLYLAENIFQFVGDTRYWSFDSDPVSPNLAWQINFLDDGALKTWPKYYSGYVRCVRGASINTLSFSRSSANIVTDLTTDLQWQDTSDLTTLALTWKESINYCENLVLDSYNDWRLPNITEQVSMINLTTYPSIDQRVFYYSHELLKNWTSTTLQSSPAIAWMVPEYSGGTLALFSKSGTISSLRCVRGGVLDDLNKPLDIPAIMYLLD